MLFQRRKLDVLLYTVGDIINCASIEQYCWNFTLILDDKVGEMSIKVAKITLKAGVFDEHRCRIYENSWIKVLIR